MPTGDYVIEFTSLWSICDSGSDANTSVGVTEETGIWLPGNSSAVSDVSCVV